MRDGRLLVQPQRLTEFPPRAGTLTEPELAEEYVAHFLTKFYVRHWLRRAGLGDHFQDGDI